MRLADALGEQLVRALCQFKRRSLDFHCFHLTRILLLLILLHFIYMHEVRLSARVAHARLALGSCVCVLVRGIWSARECY